MWRKYVKKNLSPTNENHTPTFAKEELSFEDHQDADPPISLPLVARSAQLPAPAHLFVGPILLLSSASVKSTW